MQMCVYKTRSDICSAKVDFFLALVGLGYSEYDPVLDRYAGLDDLSCEDIYDLAVFEQQVCFNLAKRRVG